MTGAMHVFPLSNFISIFERAHWLIEAGELLAEGVELGNTWLPVFVSVMMLCHLTYGGRCASAFFVPIEKKRKKKVK